MSFSRYASYKPSGVEWLEDVPEHWSVRSIKSLTPVLRGASPRPINDPKYFDEDGEYAWVRIADVSASDGWLRTSPQRLSKLGQSLSVRLEPGALFVSIAGSVGKPCIAAIKACIHDGFVYFPRLPIDARFLFRVFEGGLCYGGLGKLGTQLNLNTDTIGAIKLALPPQGELQAIIAFLDRETAKIDALVDEQKRLIELLNEKRQAVISHAVTKGLDPNAPTKDSGIEWLGQIPEHWTVISVRHLLNRIEQGRSPECENRLAESEEWGILKAGCVNGGVFRPDEHKALPTALDPVPSLEVRPGDILMSRANGSPEDVGAVSHVTQVRPRLMLSDKIFRLHPARTGLPVYLAAVLGSRHTRMQIESTISGADGLANNLPQSTLLAFRGVLPPKDEQVAIVRHLSFELGKLQPLERDCEQLIERLQERRSALISAAVTGKIDVRGLAQDKAKAA